MHQDLWHWLQDEVSFRHHWRSERRCILPLRNFFYRLQHLRVRQELRSFWLVRVRSMHQDLRYWFQDQVSFHHH